MTTYRALVSRIEEVTFMVVIGPYADSITDAAATQSWDLSFCHSEWSTGTPYQRKLSALRWIDSILLTT